MSHKRSSLLKKSLSDRSVVLKRSKHLKSRPKPYKTEVFSLRTGVRKGHEGVFQHAGPNLGRFLFGDGGWDPFLENPGTLGGCIGSSLVGRVPLPHGTSPLPSGTLTGSVVTSWVTGCSVSPAASVRPSGRRSLRGVRRHAVPLPYAPYVALSACLSHQPPR